MSRDGSITLPFADGPKHFRLAWGELIKVQDECKAGPFEIYNRLLTGRWKMGEISNTIRWGLIGGGMPPAEALQFVETYVQSRPPLESLPLAQGILGTGLGIGVEEAPGELEGEAANELTISPTGSSE